MDANWAHTDPSSRTSGLGTGDFFASDTNIRRALHPVTQVPAGRAWNLADLDGLIDLNVPLRPAAVLVGLVPRPEALTILLTVRNGDLRHHAGQVSFPGGSLEPADRGPAAAALRETQEEVGIPPALVHPLGWLDPIATITGFRVLPLVAQLPADIAPVADPREVARIFEVPAGYLLDRANQRRLTVRLRGRTREVLEYATPAGAERIWGVTALILGNFIDRLDALAARQTRT